jgi:hypothetical protein
MPLLLEGDEDLLPPYTLGERSRELRQRSILLRWRARRLRARSMTLLYKHCPFGLYLPPSSHLSLPPP